MNIRDTPLISIGMPVFNGELTIRGAIDSVLNQNYKNFELIISNNQSTDLTHSICQEYAASDRRVKYIRQSVNIGSALNFKYVLEKAVGKYFIWAAADDFRSSDFLEENVGFLEFNLTYVASTSPNYLEGQEQTAEGLINFDIKGEVFERFQQFFQYCWKSHGIFYSLIRTSVLKECSIVGQSYIAADWAIDLYLASRGNINRVKKGLTVFGTKGVSSSKNPYRAFRNHPIEIIIPFYRLSCYVMVLSKEFTFIERMYLIRIMAKLNIQALLGQFISTLYQLYSAYIKPLKK